MKQLLLLCAVFGAVFYFSSFKSGYQATEGHDNPSFVRSFNVNGPVSLKLSTSGGSIKVIQGNQDQVEVEFYVRKGGKIQDMSLAQLREYKEINISHQGNEIEISVKNKNKSWNSKHSVAFVAHTPRKTSASIATSGGSLTIESVDGNQSLATSGGSIKLGDIIGDISASTSGGSIVGKALYGKVQVTTSGGSIKMMQLDGSLRAATSGGSIALNGISGSASASTSGGSISAEFDKLDGDLNLSTSGGSIKVDLPNDVSANVDLKATSSATLDIDGFRGEAKKTKVNGTLNGGGHDVKCRTSGGSVRVF